LYRVQEQLFTRPNLILGSSGGAIVGTLGQGANWNAEKLYELAGNFSSDKLIAKSLVPSFFNWLFAGSAVMISSSLQDYCKSILQNKIDIEMIYGAHCRETGKHVLFSSATKEGSIFQVNSADWKGYEMIFLDNNIDKIARSLMATTSLPNVFDPVCVKSKETYIDGGISAPSPWSSLWESIITKPGKLKIIYFVSTNISGVSPYRSLDAFYRMVHNMCSREYRDVLTAFRIRSLQKNIKYNEIHTKDLVEAVNKYKQMEEAVLICIPTHDPSRYNFDFTYFHGKELQSIMLKFNSVSYIVIGW